MESNAKAPEKKKLKITDLLMPFLFPTIVGKTLILYFGLNYANYPDEGYGVGLICAIVFTVFMLTRFVWKFRHYE